MLRSLFEVWVEWLNESVVDVSKEGITFRRLKRKEANLKRVKIKRYISPQPNIFFAQMLDPLTFGLGKKVAPTSIASPAATSIAPAAAPSISPPAATSTNHSRRASSSPSRNSSRARTQETDTEGGGRTQVPPTGATRIQPTRKVKHKSQTLNAPYVKLTPISDDQSDLMDVDSMEDEKTVRSNTSSIMKPPIIVCSVNIIRR